VSKLSATLFLFVAAILLRGSPANADQTKQLTIEPGKATVVANLVSPRPDCSTNPGPQLLPNITEKPLHGTIGIQIAVTDVAAAGACPARKVPSLALFYAAPAGYTGNDSFQIEINEGNNQQTRVSYQVTVQAALPQPSAAQPTAAKP
jgi:hypothetical protein